MSPSCDTSDRPAEVDPYAYFAARGVSREALRGFFEAEVERSAMPNRVEGGPIAELYRLLGLDWTVALVALLGGTENYVPWSADVAVQKWPELPAELCGVLVDAYGGGKVEVPSLRRLFAACRQKLMAQRIASGLSYNAVAREFGVTARHVRSVVAGALTPNRLSHRNASEIQEAPIIRRARGRARATAPC